MQTKKIEFKSRPALESYRLQSFDIMAGGDILSHGQAGAIIHNLYVRFYTHKSFADLTMTSDDAFLLAVELMKATAVNKSAHEVMVVLEEISNASGMEQR